MRPYWLDLLAALAVLAELQTGWPPACYLHEPLALALLLLHAPADRVAPLGNFVETLVYELPASDQYQTDPPELPAGSLLDAAARKADQLDATPHLQEHLPAQLVVTHRTLLLLLLAHPVSQRPFDVGAQCLPDQPQ